MMRTLVSVALATVVAACGAQQEKSSMPNPANSTSTQTSRTKPTRSGHVDAHGVRYYYEVRGEGEPLLLLHGGLGSIDMFAPLMPTFTAHRQVIAVDLHGHGRTRLGERKISLVDQGRDMAVILDALGVKTVDTLGYSFGGGVALQFAAQNPARVRRLVLVSAGYSQDGFYPEMLPMQAQVGAAMADMMKNTPMYKAYAAIAPDPSEFPTLLDRMGELMRQPYNYADDVKKLTMPVLLVFGDSDMFRLEHVVDFYKLLGGGQKDAGWQREHMAKNRLAILPDVTHYEMFMVPTLAQTALAFLDGTGTAPTWSNEVAAQR